MPACAILLCATVRAEVDPVSPPAPDSRWERVMEGVENGIDSFHGKVSRGISGVVRDFDRFFGEDLIDQEDGTLIRLGMTSEFRESDQSSFNVFTQLRLELPQLENRLQIVFDDMVEKNEEKSVVEEVRDSQPLTGLRYTVKENKTRYNADIGVKLREEPDFYLRGRVSREFAKTPWSIKPSQDVAWFLEDGFGSRTQLRISRKMSSDRVASLRTYCDWEENKDGVTFIQALSLYDKITSRRVMRCNVALEAPTRPRFDVEKYWLTVNYRQLIHANWLYVEVTPGFEFPRDRDYEATPFIELRIEMLLGDIRKLWMD
jgi:hypothetical protein